MKPLTDRLADRELIQRGDLTLSYRARDRVLDRPVFVKLLNPALSADAEIRARFEREARAVARLDHPNLVRIYEYGEDPGEGLYMILEWVEGETLGARLARQGALPAAEWQSLAQQLLAGLAGLHSVGILHRDLKPENILVRESADGVTYKITDFSLAALRDAPRLTHHEAIVGTPAYMAPEQAAGGSPDERSDLFSLGTILYEAATGTNPFTAPTLLETLKLVREREAPMNHPAVVLLPEKGRTLLSRLLEKDPAARPAHAREGLALLGEKYVPPHVRPRSHRRDLVHLGLAVLVVAVWAGLMLRWPGKERLEPMPVERAAVDTVLRAMPEDTAAVPPATPRSEPEFRTAIPKQERIPEFRAPVVDTARTVTESVLPTETIPPLPDSVDLHLITEPWADVYLAGVKLGTTPLSEPLRLPAGQQQLVLRNPAFPPVQQTVELAGEAVRAEVRLAEHITLVRVSVTPWGELYVDGEHVGTTPLARPLFVAAGRHTLRISHPQLSAVEQIFQSAAGETLSVNVDLTVGQAAITRSSGRNFQ